MHIEQKIMQIKPEPRDAIDRIPILELCELIQELHKKIEDLEDRLERVEWKI